VGQATEALVQRVHLLGMRFAVGAACLVSLLACPLDGLLALVALRGELSGVSVLVVVFLLGEHAGLVGPQGGEFAGVVDPKLLSLVGGGGDGLVGAVGLGAHALAFLFQGFAQGKQLAA
jgi:hypothetical protein